MTELCVVTNLNRLISRDIIVCYERYLLSKLRQSLNINLLNSQLSIQIKEACIIKHIVRESRYE